MTKDGGRRLIAWSNRPMAGPDGEPVALVTTGIDLTDRERPPQDERALEGDPEAKLVEVARLANEQRALRRVATLVASEVSPERVFTAVSEECARVLQVNASVVLRYEGDGTATIVGRHNRDSVDVFRLGEALPADERLRARRASCATGAPARIDDWGGLTGEIAEAIFRTGYRSTAAAPIVVAGALWGAVGDRERGPAAARHREPARRVLRARLAGRRQRPGARGPDRLARAARQGGRRAAPPARAQPARRRAAAARLRRARRCASRGRGWPRSPRPRRGLLEEAARELDTGLAELREIARGLHPAILSEHGLRRALDALAERLAGPGRRSTRPTERLPEHLEATAYYIVSEALTNVAKHAAATARARVAIAATAACCAARSPTTAAAAPTRRAAPACSACATAPRRPAGRSSLRQPARPRDGGRRRRCR